MRKEILLAIVAGGLLGLAVAFGVWKANSALKPEEEIKGEETQEPLFGEGEITIATPDSFEVVTAPSVQLSGISSESAWVVAMSEEEDSISEVDKKGDFEVEVELASGLNKLLVFGLGEDGGHVETELSIVYSSAFKKYFENLSESEIESTGEGDVIRKNVAEKLNEAKAEGVAYVGVVTDVSEETLQLKADGEEIRLVSVDGETDFVKIGKESKSVEFEDVAIGDFVIAMGFANGNGVLEGKRVLVTTEPEAMERTAVLGEVISIEGKVVMIDTGDSKWTLSFPKSWVGPEISELEEEMKVIVAGEEGDGEITVRTIEIVDQLEEATD